MVPPESVESIILPCIRGLRKEIQNVEFRITEPSTWRFETIF